MGVHATAWIESVLGSVAILECSTTVNGLRFYTPDACGEQALTAYEWCAANLPCTQIDVVDDKPEGVYTLTPAGEHLLADLDVKPLLQVEADLKRVRAASDSDHHHTNSDGNRE